MASRVVRVLEEARARVAKGWCQRAYALDADGKPLWATDRRATKWCLRGAVFASAYDDHEEPFLCLARAGVGEGTAWNDKPGRTQAEVIAVLDHAIALAQAHP